MPTVVSAVSFGTKATCAKSATVARTPVATNDSRQDASVAISVPSGTPMTVADETPPRMHAIACAVSRACTMRPAAAVASVQNPPNAIPNSALPASIVVKFVEYALTKFEHISNPVNIKSMYLRSHFPATTTEVGAAKAAITPGKVIIKPAVPDVTCRSRAMCARRPTGRNSQVTNANALTATANTANH
ncbi:hypothetical protein F01_460556 [Burkholderia cenocepacia]|nr:hypothetical protein F01_460556 [Burkholderia cenocepacia]